MDAKKIFREKKFKEIKLSYEGILHYLTPREAIGKYVKIKPLSYFRDSGVFYGCSDQMENCCGLIFEVDEIRRDEDYINDNEDDDGINIPLYEIFLKKPEDMHNDTYRQCVAKWHWNNEMVIPMELNRAVKI